MFFHCPLAVIGGLAKQQGVNGYKEQGTLPYMLMFHPNCSLQQALSPHLNVYRVLTLLFIVANRFT